MDIPGILNAFRTVAVVGLSPNEARPSNRVAAYLKKVGYKIIPVNPGHKEILGEKCYPSVADIPESVDIVDVFRKPGEVMPVAVDAVKKGAKVLWLQEGIISEDAAGLARAAGLEVIMDKCILKEHMKIAGEPEGGSL